MSGFEASYKSLLQGVSQQVPRERLPGQVTSQDNMLSDIVTNLRRRPGVEYKYDIQDFGATPDNIAVWYTDVAGRKAHIMVNTTTGALRIMNTAFVEEYTATVPYLIASGSDKVRATTVGDEFFIGNVEQAPTHTNTPTSAYLGGFFFIRTAAFSKSYSVTLKNSTGQWTYAYTTPDGTSAGDAAKATPEYIVEQLRASIAATAASRNIDSVQASGANAFVRSNNGALSVTSNSGTLYVVTSGSSSIRSDSDLPPNLPANGDDYIIATGPDRGKVYYRYDSAEAKWLEDGIPGSVASITNMPISVTHDGTTWSHDTGPFEGRLAGDDDTNPDPTFLERGITGMGAYQGRLVILAGSMVALSASNKPRRFYRATVTAVLDDDSIHIGASANSSAAYEYCVPFQKDLLLFASEYQALIPSGNTAITPRTATVVLTSTYDADMSCTPITLGRTLMYPAPSSADFFGIMEMLPSSFTDSQYTSVNVTQHLPKYMGGRCRFGVSSSVATLALFGPTGDTKSLIVHEYSWDAEEKVQQAWHRWNFRHDIAAAYFAGSSIVVLFVANGHLVGGTIDPRIGFMTADDDRRPFLDLYSYTNIVDHQITIPSWLAALDPTGLDSLRVAQAQGELAGEPVGFAVSGPDTLTTVRSYPSGVVAVGYPFFSSVTPTAPLVKDRNDVVISSNKLTILRYSISTTNSAEYRVLVRDSAYGPDQANQLAGTLFWTSEELQLGEARVGGNAVAVIPLRTNAASTTMVIYTDSLGELNLIGLEYVCRYNQKIRRR